MGMYTQCRGWLNVDSIGKSNLEDFEKVLNKAKIEFRKKYDSTELRAWVCEDTWVHCGGNGSAWIFFGTELKNYERDFETWVKFLLSYFPNAEGRIDFQYEEECIGGFECPMGIICDTSRYWEIYDGKVTKEDFTPTWCEGYGNMA